MNTPKDKKIIKLQLKWALSELNVRVWTENKGLCIGSTGGLL